MKCYKTELDLNDKQVTACFKHAGVARFAYNWGLQRKKEAYEATGKSPTAIDLHKELVILKKTEFSWMHEVSKCAPQEALRNLDRAFEGFFRRCKSGTAKKGYPKFKSRKRGVGAFALTGAIKVNTHSIILPRLGILRLKERNYLPTDARVTSATVSERAGRWFVSINTDETPVRPLGTETLGVDMGIKSLAVLSDGTVFENPKALKNAEAKLRRLNKSVSRKVKGSRNRKRAADQLARQHYRISCIRNDALHKVSDAITKRTSTVVLESLNVKGMLKNHKLAKSISDAAFSELHRQITYKMGWAGGTVIKADPFYPSSKTCSACGAVKETLNLGERTFVCPECGLEIDRDENAAINLRNLAVSSTVTACCPGSSGSLVSGRTKLPVEQEPDSAWIG